MTRLRTFLRDRRGTAMIDYVAAGALLASAGETAMRHGMALNMLLKAATGA